jgi:hypothetical protein
MVTAVTGVVTIGIKTMHIGDSVSVGPLRLQCGRRPLFTRASPRLHAPLRHSLPPLVGVRHSSQRPSRCPCWHSCVGTPVHIRTRAWLSPAIPSTMLLAAFESSTSRQLQHAFDRSPPGDSGSPYNNFGGSNNMTSFVFHFWGCPTRGQPVFEGWRSVMVVGLALAWAHYCSARTSLRWGLTC